VTAEAVKYTAQVNIIIIIIIIIKQEHNELRIVRN